MGSSRGDLIGQILLQQASSRRVTCLQGGVGTPSAVAVSGLVQNGTRILWTRA